MKKNLFLITLLLGYVFLAIKPDALSSVKRRLGFGLDVTQQPHYQSMSRKYAHHGLQIARKDNRNSIVFMGDSIIEHWDISVPDRRAINLGISNDSSKGVLARLDDNYISHVPTWYLAIGVNDDAFGYKLESIESRLNEIAYRLAPVERLLASSSACFKS